MQTVVTLIHWLTSHARMVMTWRLSTSMAVATRYCKSSATMGARVPEELTARNMRDEINRSHLLAYTITYVTLF